MGLTLEHLDHAWVTGLCRELAATAHGGSPADDVRVHAFELSELSATQGVLSRYQPSTREAIVGHRLLSIRWSLRGAPREDRLVLKSKAPGAAVRRRLEAVYERFDPRLAALQHRLAPSILDDVHTRELAVYERAITATAAASLRAIAPAIHLIWRDPAAQIFTIVMEHLDGVRHASTLHDLDAWQPADIAHALAGIARVHGEHLGAYSAAAPPPWLVPFARLHNTALLDYQAALLAYNAAAFPDLFPAPRARRLETLLAAAPARHREIAARPLTLIHGDFTPRNTCLRLPSSSPATLCAYDWELAQLHLPQRDLVELLCYVLSPSLGWRHPTTAQLLSHYRAHLEAAAGHPLPAADFHRDLALALAEFCTFKLLVQGITHQLLGAPAYFERLVHNAFDALDHYSQGDTP